MTTVRKRADTGKWEVRYRDPHGRSRRKSFPRKVDADRFRTELDHSISIRSDWVDPRHGRVTFGDWWDQWWTGQRSSLRATTQAQRESVARSLILPAFGAHQIGKITQPEVQAWVTRLTHDEGKAPATVRKAAQVFGAAMSAAVDAGLLSRTPCRGIALPSERREEMRFLGPRQIADLAGEIAPRYRALVLVAAYSGLRIGELAALRRSQVDEVRGRVRVVETLVEVGGRLTTHAPKTNAGRRTVPLPGPVAEELRAHLETHEVAADGYVFTSPTGQPLRVPTYRRRVWLPAVDSAGLAGLRIHDLRHTAVALWIATGENPKRVSALAGHTSVSFTLDRYGHLFENDEDRMTDALAAMFEAARST